MAVAVVVDVGASDVGLPAAVEVEVDVTPGAASLVPSELAQLATSPAATTNAIVLPTHRCRMSALPPERSS
jgi:hypothetical protein